MLKVAVITEADDNILLYIDIHVGIFSLRKRGLKIQTKSCFHVVFFSIMQPVTIWTLIHLC